MKKTFIILSILTIAVIYFSCKSSTTSPTDNSSLTSISGIIENWSQGVQSLKLVTYNGYGPVILASTQISATGSFNINLPASVNDSMLSTLKFNNDTFCTGNVVINPADLKISSSELSVYQNDSLYIGFLYYTNDTSGGTGATYVYYNYFNATGTMKGNYNCKTGYDSSVSTYDMSVSKGWNGYATKFLTITPAYHSMTVNSTLPTGLKWKFNAYPSGKKNIFY